MKAANTVVLTLVVYMIVCSVTAQNLLYVDPSGTQEGPGTSDKPFSQLSYATAASHEGDLILVKPGTYTGSVLVRHQLDIYSTQGSNATIIQCRDGEVGVTVVGEDVPKPASRFEIHGFTFEGCDEAISAGRRGASRQDTLGSMEIQNCEFRANGDAIAVEFYPHSISLQSVLIERNQVGLRLSKGSVNMAARQTVFSNNNLHHVMVEATSSSVLWFSQSTFEGENAVEDDAEFAAYDFGADGSRSVFTFSESTLDSCGFDFSSHSDNTAVSIASSRMVDCTMNLNLPGAVSFYGSNISRSDIRSAMRLKMLNTSFTDSLHGIEQESKPAEIVSSTFINTGGVICKQGADVSILSCAFADNNPAAFSCTPGCNSYFVDESTRIQGKAGGEGCPGGGNSTVSHARRIF